MVAVNSLFFKEENKVVSHYTVTVSLFLCETETLQGESVTTPTCTVLVSHYSVTAACTVLLSHHRVTITPFCVALISP